MIPKYKAGDEVRLVGVIQKIQCLSLGQGWQYQVCIEGCTLEDIQISNYPNILERGINLDKIPEMRKNPKCWQERIKKK